MKSSKKIVLVTTLSLSILFVLIRLLSPANFISGVYIANCKDAQCADKQIIRQVSLEDSLEFKTVTLLNFLGSRDLHNIIDQAMANHSCGKYPNPCQIEIYEIPKGIAVDCKTYSENGISESDKVQYEWESGTLRKDY